MAAVRSRRRLAAGLTAALALCLGLSVGLGAGTGHAAAAWSDPVAYCRAVGTIDAPDARYTGPALPDWIPRALMRDVHAPPDAPLSPFRHAAWRCMGGAVTACFVGANIPCRSKADASRTPSAGAVRFCAANPAAALIPAYAAGRATVFEWRCTSGAPAIVRQVLRVDAAGYATEFWHRVAP